MPGEYYIELRRFDTGARLAVLTGATSSGDAGRNAFLKMTCAMALNAPGSLQFDVPADLPGLWSLPDKTQAVLWRRDTARGIDWYRAFVGLIRDGLYRSKSGERAVTLTCPGLMSILSWYQVLWPANVTNRTTWTATKAETLMKTLVTYNAVAASALAAAGRDRNAPNYGVSVQADAAGGTTLDWTANRSHTLLDELQSLALIGGGDFDLVYTSATAREFRFYAGQRGADKTALITFSERSGTMDNVRYARTRSMERTVALVAGGGQEAQRTTTIRTGPTYAADNDIEVFVDAKDLNPDTAAARQSRGDARLDELQSRDTFTFDVVQTQGVYYGPSGTGAYTLGDLVQAVRPDGVSVTQQIASVTLGWDAQETLGIGVRTP